VATVGLPMKGTLNQKEAIKLLKETAGRKLAAASTRSR
jgi:hypothetical protein